MHFYTKDSIFKYGFKRLHGGSLHPVYWQEYTIANCRFREMRICGSGIQWHLERKQEPVSRLRMAPVLPPCALSFAGTVTTACHLWPLSAARRLSLLDVGRLARCIGLSILRIRIFAILSAAAGETAPKHYYAKYDRRQRPNASPAARRGFHQPLHGVCSFHSMGQPGSTEFRFAF